MIITTQFTNWNGINKSVKGIIIFTLIDLCGRCDFYGDRNVFLTVFFWFYDLFESDFIEFG
jgi:hypothetical protein